MQWIPINFGTKIHKGSNLSFTLCYLCLFGYISILFFTYKMKIIRNKPLKSCKDYNYRCENKSNILKSKQILISMIYPDWDKRRQGKLEDFRLESDPSDCLRVNFLRGMRNEMKKSLCQWQKGRTMTTNF